MTRRFTRILAALALLVIVTQPIKMRAEDVTVTLTSTDIASGSYSSEEKSFQNGGIDFGYIRFIKNSKNTPSGWAANLIMQNNKTGSGTSTIYPALYNTEAFPGKIKTIRICYANPFTNYTLSYGATSGDLTPLSTLTTASGTESVTHLDNNNNNKTEDLPYYEYDLSSYNATYFRYSAAAANYIYKMVIVYEEVSSTGPSITANDVNIAYNSISGSIGYSVNNPVSGTNLTASVPSGSWLTLGSVTSDAVSFTCAVNEGAERTATVTLSYEGADDKEVTVTQAAAPVIYTTIPALFEAATSTSIDVNVTFGNWVVSGVAGSNVYVTDNIGNGFIIYKSNHGFSVNNKLSGTVSNTPLKLYKGSAEFTNLTSSTDGLSVSNDGEISVITNKTISDLGGVNTGAVIQLNNLTYDGTNLSDGTNTIKPYNSLYSNMSFTSGKTYNVTGVYLQFDDIKEILPRSVTDIVEVTQEYTLTVNASADVVIFTFVGETTGPGVEGPTTLQVNNGTEVGLSVSVTEGYLLTLVVDDIDVTSQLDETGYYTFTMPTHNVTVTATAELAPLYSVVLCDDNTTLTEASYGAGVTLPTRNGDETYTFAGWSTTNVENETTTAPTIIPAGAYHPTQNIALFPVYTRTEAGSGTTTEWHLTELADVDAGVYAILTESYLAFNGTINSNGHGEATSVAFVFDANGVATSAPSGTLELTFTAVESGFTMYNPTSQRYLYASKAGSGGLAWSASENNYWFYFVSQTSSSWRYSKSYEGNYANLRVYNNTFRTYQNISQGDIKLAKKVEVSGSTTYYTSLLNSTSLTIAPDQWYLIASPVGDVNPIAVGSMTEDQTYGLYSFDQDGGGANGDDKEWRNYKAGAFSQLAAGTGYLYINQNGCTLTFTGTAYTGTGTFQLDYSSSTGITESFRGLNLVGNPYNAMATIDRDYYIMNANGTDLAPYTSDDIVPAMQGVFVKATEEGQYVTFTPNQSTTGGKGIEINLSQNRGNVIDRAIVRFGEGSQLAKVQLFDNSTKLYIPQGNQDYAVVRSNGQGEMPVNFSAAENGTYTLGMDVKNMDVNYLHLIDNMTGMDVDLLQTPSYTFEATTTDYESRFRLVFASSICGDADGDNDNFAFFSNGSLIVNNEGNATLQVIDLTGRILSSESVNGSVSTTLNAPTGVYMLRLINGDNVKVQKIVVR